MNLLESYLQYVKFIEDNNLDVKQQLQEQGSYRNVAYGFIKRDDKYYFITGKDWKYGLVGGGVDEGEDPIEAFRRETLEEVHIKLDNIIPLSGPHTWTYKKKNKDVDGSILYFFYSEFKEENKDLWGDGPEGKLNRKLIPMSVSLHRESPCSSLASGLSMNPQS